MKIASAIFLLAAWNPPDTQIRDVLPLADLANAISGGCVADVAGILIKEDGTPVDPAFQERCITISYEQPAPFRGSWQWPGAPAKRGQSALSLGAGLITELVTDHALALAVLGELDA